MADRRRKMDEMEVSLVVVISQHRRQPLLHCRDIFTFPSSIIFHLKNRKKSSSKILWKINDWASDSPDLWRFSQWQSTPIWDEPGRFRKQRLLASWPEIQSVPSLTYGASSDATWSVSPCGLAGLGSQGPGGYPKSETESTEGIPKGRRATHNTDGQGVPGIWP